jgi:hypothetical protein
MTISITLLIVRVICFLVCLFNSVSVEIRHNIQPYPSCTGTRILVHSCTVGTCLILVSTFL